MTVQTQLPSCLPWEHRHGSIHLTQGHPPHLFTLLTVASLRSPKSYAIRKAGATPEANDKDGNTCLHHAVKLKCHELVKLLVEAGASVQALNSGGESPLLLTAKLDSTLAAISLPYKSVKVWTNVITTATLPFLLHQRGEAASSVATLSLYTTAQLKVDDKTLFFTTLSNAVKAGDVDLISRLVAIGAAVSEWVRQKWLKCTARRT